MQPIQGTVITAWGPLTHTNGNLNVSPAQRNGMRQTTAGYIAYSQAEMAARNDYYLQLLAQQAFNNMRKKN